MAFACFDRARRVARRHPGRPAILQGDRTVSFAELLDRGLHCAAALEVDPGGRVMLGAANSPDFAAAVLGLWARGAIPVLIHADAPASHFDHAARLTEAVAILGDRGTGALPARPLPARPPEAPQSPDPSAPQRPAQSAHDPASILFTSGSTGLPKGVTQSAGALIDGADRIAAHLGYAADERILCPVPFAFDYGWGQLLNTLFAGHTLVLPEARGAASACAAIAAHRPTVLAGVPAFFADLLNGLSPIAQTDVACIRLVTTTGSKVPPAVFAAMAQTFAHADISLNYGLTETYRSASLPVHLARSQPQSVGLAVPGVDLAILRDDGTPAAAMETGEIVHRGAGVFLGYWGEPARTAAVRRPDPLWRHVGLDAPPAVFTGDLGWTDEAGLLHLAGRRDRQLKSMGVRVSPEEIETLLLDSGLVAEAAVVARPHDTLGDMVVAVLAPDDPAPLKALKAHARQTMSPSMQPRDWILLPALPRLPGGKVDYAALGRMAQG